MIDSEQYPYRRQFPCHRVFTVCALLRFSIRRKLRPLAQGQRELSVFPGKDLQQVVDAPSCHATLHDVAFLARMLLDETQCEPAKP